MSVYQWKASDGVLDSSLRESLGRVERVLAAVSLIKEIAVLPSVEEKRSVHHVSVTPHHGLESFKRESVYVRFHI